MSAITTRSGDNFDYSTAALLLDVNGELIQRTTLTADSADFISVTATDLATGFLNSSAAQYNGSSFTVTVQNTSSSFTITQSIGFTEGTITPGTGYSTASGLSTTGGTGTGMLVDIVDTAGAITSVTIVDVGSGYVATDSITVVQGGGSGGSFILNATGISMTPTTTYVIAPLGSATFTFIKDTDTTFKLMVKDSGTLYAPVGPVTANAVMVFDGTTGNLVSETGVLIDGSDNITGVTSMTLDSVILAGSTSGFITLDAPAVVTDYAITFPAAVGTNGQVLTTDASGNTTWETPSTGLNSSFSAYGPNAVGSISATNNTYTVVLIDTTTVIDGGNFSLTSGVLTITNAGDYLVSYTVQFQTLDQSGGKDSSMAGHLALNGTGNTILGSITECYINEFNGDLIRPSVSKTMIITFAASDTVALEATRTTGTTTATTSVDKCTLTLRRLS